MRKCLIFLLIISSIVFAQFEPGTISVGALFGYNSFGDSEREEVGLNVMSVGDGQMEFLVVKPTVSYFITGNISVDGIMNIMRIKYNNDEDYDPRTIRLIGGGATMYIKQNFYAGGSFALQSNKQYGDDWTWTKSAQFVGAQGGFIHKVAKNVYLDVRVNYLMGIGNTKYKDEDDFETEKWEDKNTANAYGINVGIKAFFKQ